MKLKTGNLSAVRAKLEGRLGCHGCDVQAARELLRSAATAHSGACRASITGRIVRCVEPVFAECCEEVATESESFVHSADLTLAPGGRLFATPIRAVDLGDGTFLIFSSLPTWQLKRRLSGELTCRETDRQCRPDDREVFAKQVTAAGGIVLGAELWAGLDRTPVADENWLEQLDRRLCDTPLPAGDGGDDTLVWTWWDPEASPSRWRNAGKAEARSGGTLWHAKTRFGYLKNAWSDGTQPTDANHVALSRDEAARTLHALARCAEKPFDFSLGKAAGGMLLATQAWLPRAEYRAISIRADSFSREGKVSQWHLPEGRAQEMAAMLAERLGMKMTGNQNGK